MSLIEDFEKYDYKPDLETIESPTESLDPRIQSELEKLNRCASDINKLENELEEAKNLFTTTKNRQLQRLEYLQKKFGACIQKSKPYYEALHQTEKLQKEAQRAVQEYQRANSLYKTAKETLSVAEQNLASTAASTSASTPNLSGLGGEVLPVDMAWQEHLSTTVTKINASKRTVDAAEDAHRRKTAEFQQAEQRCFLTEKELKRHIVKSQLYYEEKSRWTIQMEAQKARIDELEKAIVQAKICYREAMKNLSKISEDIHSKRTCKR